MKKEEHLGTIIYSRILKVTIVLGKKIDVEIRAIKLCYDASSLIKVSNGG